MVLKSIDWALVKFDVLCIETDPIFRPKNYVQHVAQFMAERGYVPYGGENQGRNSCKSSLTILNPNK